MKKRIISVFMCVCIIACLFTISISAISGPAIGAIGASVRLCPGKQITNIAAPEVTSANTVTASGWMVQKVGGAWVEYAGEALDEKYNGAKIKYFATDENGTEYSTEATLTVAHNLEGGYEHNDVQHWRVCSDCGEKCNKEFHTWVDGMQCSVCGAEQTPAAGISIASITMLMNFFMKIIEFFSGLVS